MSNEPQARLARPRFHADPDVDRLMAMLSALTQEVAVLGDRLDTHERLFEQHAVFRPQEVDAYEPPEPVRGERQARRKRLIASVYRPVFELAGAAAEDEAGYEQFVDSLESPTGDQR